MSSLTVLFLLCMGGGELKGRFFKLKTQMDFAVVDGLDKKQPALTRENCSFYLFIKMNREGI